MQLSANEQCVQLHKTNKALQSLEDKLHRVSECYVALCNVCGGQPAQAVCCSVTPEACMGQ